MFPAPVPLGNARIVPIAGLPGIDTLPVSLKILAENLCRQALGGDPSALAPRLRAVLARETGAQITFQPSRIFGQDILGLVMLVDMAGLRDALAEAGADPAQVQPRVPIDIVIDHSLQVDAWARPDAAAVNLAREYARNAERFAFLRWCAESFAGTRVVPPGKGIMHQIHIERIAEVVRAEGGLLSPDTCVGTDSHTPMVNGVGVLGWGVGGIEAEAVMLGQPVSMALPRVVGLELTGRLPAGTTPTDLVLTVTQRLRAEGVVGAFVEAFGEGVAGLPVGTRATIANMAPEYGATAVLFPVDAETIAYLRMTGRSPEHVARVEAYARAQGLWAPAVAPAFDAVVRLDLGTVEPSLAGPRNPEDRLPLSAAAATIPGHLSGIAGRPLSPAGGAAAGEAGSGMAADTGPGGAGRTAAGLVQVAGTPERPADRGLVDGDVVIAAITSCTNTSSPEGIVTAALLARNAVARGLAAKPWVKTSFAPGSQVVADVLVHAGLQPALDALGFQVVGFGCTTCNGGSGPLPSETVAAIDAGGLVATAVLSGNRNFQGRIHPNVRAAYLASPALVVAYALAGSMLADVASGPLGHDPEGRAVRLADIWPEPDEVARVIAAAYRPEAFADAYAGLFDGGPAWDALARPGSARFDWDPASTYLRRPPWFNDLPRHAAPPPSILGLRPLVLLGDRISTDHISPSGAISLGTPSADWLLAHGVPQAAFNAYTTRRGHHEVAERATFANIRLQNAMAGREGPFTRLMPEGEVMRIHDATEVYRSRGVPLAVIAGDIYGSGSSRDWAAKGVLRLGVRVVLAEGFERIHRANLVGMGVLPLQFAPGQGWRSLGLDGSEVIDLPDLTGIGVLAPVAAVIRHGDGRETPIVLTARLETAEDVHHWRQGGILPAVWRAALDDAAEAPAGTGLTPDEAARAARAQAEADA